MPEQKSPEPVQKLDDSEDESALVDGSVEKENPEKPVFSKTSRGFGSEPILPDQKASKPGGWGRD